MSFFSSKKSKVLMLFACLVILLGIVFSSEIVSAVDTVVVKNPNDTQICVKNSTGEFVKTYEGSNGSCGYDQATLTIKKIGDIFVHCVNWGLSFINNNEHAKVSSWNNKSKAAIMGGFLIKHLEAKDFGSFEKGYVKIGATLNTLFANYVNDSSSYDYLSNPEIKGYINEAETYYKNVKLNNKLPAISLSTSSNSLSYNATSGKYFSSKITASGFVSTYGGDKTSYKITATASNGAVVNICTNSSGTKCNTSVSVPNGSTSYSFYLFVDEKNITSKDTVVVKVSGSNKSVYYTSNLYYNVEWGSTQKILISDEITYSRSVSKSSVFTIPDLVSHRIRAYKVDENGEYLDGATLELYKDEPNVKENLLASNNGTGHFVDYYFDKVASNADDFFNHDYYLVEKSAPDGYVFSSINKFYAKGSSNNSGITCYYNGGSETDEYIKVDDGFCYPENYKYMCQKPDSDEMLDLNESGNCEFEVVVQPEEGEEVVPEDDTNTDNGEAGDTTLNNGDGNEQTGNDNLEVVEPKEETKIVNYNKVCYNTEKKAIVDDAYCNSKESYTKVNSANGNITVKQVNVKNVVSISKRDITGDKEISGASLKICTKASYDKDKDNCVAAVTIDGQEMSWISGEEAHNIYGVAVGSYYIVEQTPPMGYVNALIATEFSIDASGTVKTGTKEIVYGDKENASIVVENKLSKISISKRDVATSEELPGAKLSICRTYLDNNNKWQMLVDQYTGECIEAVLADGEEASWISGNEPKIIEGLAVGTYYLVERIAPDGYDIAESILFTLNNDGTLVDRDGKKLSDNKIVMLDKEIKEVETGLFSTYMVIGIVLLVSGLGIGSYYFLKKSNNKKMKSNEE